MNKKQGFVALFFLLPYMVIFILFRLIPSLGSIYISFTKWNIVGTPKFIGVDNYAYLFKDSDFYLALVNNLKFLVIVLPILMVASFLFAYILNEKIPGRNVVRTISIIPYVLMPAVVGIMWNWMYEANFGIINYLISFLNMKHVGWLIDKNIAIYSVSMVVVWSFLGYNMILYLAGLQGINTELYEAAYVDGASKIQTLFRITIPLLMPITSLIVTLTIINIIQVFDQVVVMTNGGPSKSTLTLLHYQYISAFGQQSLGYGSAIGVFIFVLLIVLVKLQSLVLRSREV